MVTDPTKRPLADLQADLDASDAELAAGDLVSGDKVHAEIQIAIDLHEAGTPSRRQRLPARGE